MTTQEQDAALFSSPLTELMSDIATDVRQLAEAHAAQMQAEMRSEIGNAEAASLWIFAGMVAIGLGTGSLLVGFGALLVEVWHWPVWGVCLMLGPMFIALGLALWMFGRQRWSKVNVVPKESLNSIQESIKCLVNSAK